jgi:hypothetical protein
MAEHFPLWYNATQSLVTEQFSLGFLRGDRSFVLYSCLIGIFMYSVGNVLYNIYLHPLRNFPGPKLAACSFLYEFYWDILKRGKYLWQINYLHEKYGE